MSNFYRHSFLALIAMLLAACGGSSTKTSTANTSTTEGTAEFNPPVRIASVNATDFAAQLGASSSGAQLLQLMKLGLNTQTPIKCGVDFYYLKFWTVGGANETTQSSGALMVPTGGSGCSGPRPVVLYAHGTLFNKATNLADITNPDNASGALIAAMYASQGYIVVAPNYAGYDISTLGYHPYLNATQQSAEMIDILAAARAVLPNTLSSATSDNGKLFLAGYSEGGHVAMATERALEAAGKPVVASAPMSGPYALEAFGDAVFFGNVNVGSTLFTPLLTTSYQKEYGNIYSAVTDVYSSTYATGIETLLPNDQATSESDATTSLFTSGKLPQAALFNSSTPMNATGNATLDAALNVLLAVPSNVNDPRTPIFAAGFGTSYLVNNSFRVAYAADAALNPDGANTTPQTAGAPLAAAVPTQGLRKALYMNDMRHIYGSLMPAAPNLLCGGENDPTVFFNNTTIMAAYWGTAPVGLITVLDVDPSAGPSGSFAAVQGAFQQIAAATLQGYLNSGMTMQQAQLTLIESYHSSVAPFCTLASLFFFSQFQ